MLCFFIHSVYIAGRVVARIPKGRYTHFYHDFEDDNSFTNQTLGSLANQLHVVQQYLLTLNTHTQGL